MANYTGNPNNFFSSTYSFSYLDNDINWDLTNHLMANTINSSSCLATNSNLDYQSLMGYCNNDQISTHQTSHLLDAKLFRNSNNEQITTSVNKDHVPHHVDSSVAVVVSPNGHECISGSLNKRKAENFAESSSSLYSSSAILNDPVKKNNNKGRGKRSKTSDKEEGKHREVVHVRARRGQATDSHSIAERVRRGKINERLRCLQDIVPGCCKTMGMAVMLDEIINYVQSLQNQVEFLSMKLTAASQFHDFNSECEHVDKKQKIKAWNSEEAQDIEMVTSKGGYDQALLSNYFYQSAAWPF